VEAGLKQALDSSIQVPETCQEKALDDLHQSGVSALLMHMEKDDKCPCPQHSCSGSLPKQAGRQLVSEKALRSLMPIYCNYTVYVYAQLVGGIRL